ncbi:MAG TPA: EamA family transporter [Streptosporangiaceae bacterium]|nr:EamA family transporter [Streptosporangiaceae bacterium]
MTSATDVRPARDAGLAGPAMILGAALSNQFGAAIGSLAFGVIGPVGVTAVRQWIAGLVLLAAGRPRWRSFTWAQRRLALLLAAVYGTMNLSLYTAIGRLGLGLAVTLEFLGPLAVALAASRRRTDLACALVAGAGVVALTRPRPATDYAGIGLALLAAACWASYILLNRQIGRRLPGAQGPAAAAGASALVFLPVGTVVLIRHPPTATALACAAAAGILSSAVPFLLDVLALRRVPAGYFGIFMSVHPVLAALVGLVVLGQPVSWEAWLSIAAIVAANAVSAMVRSTAVRSTAVRSTAVRPDGDDHGRADDARPRDPGRAEPLAEQQVGQDGPGQRLEQGQQGGRARGGGPQAAEEERVGHGGGPGAERGQQAGGRERRPEAQASR